MSVIYNLSGLVAHNMSGLSCCQEVTDETDGMATGDTEDEIRGGIRRVAGKTADSGGSGADIGCK